MERLQQHRFIDLASPATENPGDRPHQGRRDFVRHLGLVALAAGVPPTALAQVIDRYDRDAPPTRYPEPDVIVLDKRFRAKLGNTPIVRLYRGTLWAEGPAWNGAGRFLVWSDIPNDEVLRWSEEDGHVGRRFRYPSHNTNGNTFDHQGRQISFCHGTRNVIRYEHDGRVTVLAERSADGQEFNAPNDGMVHPDGWLLFTDPGYGGLMEYRGEPAAGEREERPADPEGGDLPRGRAGQGGEGRRRARQAQRPLLLPGLQDGVRR